MNVIEWLQGKKTYIIAAGAIFTALGAYLNGAIGLTELVMAIFGAIGLSTLRAGVSKVARVIIAGAILFGQFGLTGCATVSPGNDPVVVNAEQKTQLAVDTFDTVEQLEFTVYPMWKTINPSGAAAARHFVNSLRRQSPDWLASARALTKAYKQNRTPENKASLLTAIAVLQGAITESQKYIGQLQTKPSAWAPEKTRKRIAWLDGPIVLQPAR